MGAGRTPVPSGADGVISRALGGMDSLITRRDPLPSRRQRVPHDRRTVGGGGPQPEVGQQRLARHERGISASTSPDYSRIIRAYLTRWPIPPVRKIPDRDGGMAHGDGDIQHGVELQQLRPIRPGPPTTRASVKPALFASCVRE